ncbi:MAG: hypothetical protein O2779_05020 [Nanoarchaeota archaeon]|nr:hypothetical protein [Nanoarchaeota archaeon]
MGYELNLGNEQWDPLVSSIGFDLEVDTPLTDVLAGIKDGLGDICRSQVVRTDDRGAAMKLYHHQYGDSPRFNVRFSGDSENIPHYDPEDYCYTPLNGLGVEMQQKYPVSQPERIKYMYVNQVLLSAPEKDCMIPESRAKALLEHLANKLGVAVSLSSVRCGWNG